MESVEGLGFRFIKGTHSSSLMTEAHARAREAQTVKDTYIQSRETYIETKETYSSAREASILSFRALGLGSRD